MTWRVGDGSNFGDLFGEAGLGIDPEVASFAASLVPDSGFGPGVVGGTIDHPTLPPLDSVVPPIPYDAAGAAPATVMPSGAPPPLPLDVGFGPPAAAPAPAPTKAVSTERKLNDAAARARRSSAASQTQGFTPDADTIFVLQSASWMLANVYRAAALHTPTNDAGFYALTVRLMQRLASIVDAAPDLEFFMPERVRAHIRAPALTEAGRAAQAQATALLDQLQLADAVWFVTDAYYETNLPAFTPPAARGVPGKRLPTGAGGQTAGLLVLPFFIWLWSRGFDIVQARLAQLKAEAIRDNPLNKAVEQATLCTAAKTCPKGTLDKVLAAVEDARATGGMETPDAGSEALPGWAKGVIAVVGGILAIALLPTILDVVRGSRAAGAAGRS